jgi:hypothetical protein
MSPQAAPQIPPSATSLAAPTGAGAPTSVAAPTAAPKRVRTVTIKQDGVDAEAPVARSAPMPAAPQPSIERAPSRVTASASAEPIAPVAAPRPVATRPVQQQADPNAPLSLSPPGAGGTARAPVMRTASAPAAAPVATSSGGGGYSVQISSQRSEAEAQAAFRSLQAKFPNQLGGQQPVIRRADLGDKGVYFRVQVGPYTSSDQASELCSSLKNAGGSCVVQRN